MSEITVGTIAKNHERIDNNMDDCVHVPVK